MNAKVAFASLAWVVLGCAPAAPPAPPPTQAEWTSARTHLTELRSAGPTGAYVEQVSISFREPGTGKLFEGRGALAVLPRKAMRMILVGPGGTTALDAWVTPDAWRFAVPPIHLVRRGGRDADPKLPIGFFRWWFLAPYEGRLRTIVGQALVLEDGDAMVSIDDRIEDGRHLVAARRKRAGVVELLGFRGREDGKPGKGDHATYRNLTTGLSVEVTVDELGEAAPEPEAFVDPDVTGEGK